ncbi:MAG: recombinase zinc beta ribbon domain-containing protein, partial [Actinomycetota bacterium]|nr:recombinase zinc beta ribbon domain-containing protein [Actinomycetota bacterium]
RNYDRGRTKFTVEHNVRKEWVAIPVPDCGVPPEWVRTARERIADNVRWQPNTNPQVRLRGRIRCACGYSMTNIRSDGRRYYVCSQHRKRGRCEHIRFHRLGEAEERVERFVLGLLRDPETLRSKVEEKAERERRVLQNTDREAGRIRSRLAKLATMEKAYSKQEAEGLVSSDTLRANLVDLAQERIDLERRLTELTDSERRLRALEALPSLIEEYLRELPHLLDLEPLLREYETSAPEATPDDPLGALYTITPERIRFLPEEELAERRRAVEEKRARRFRELYAMLGLKVVCHKDRSLEVSWGAHCSEWLGRG